MINPFIHFNETFIPVDSWVPEPQDLIFKHTKGAMILPVSEFYGVTNNTNFDCFVLSTKRCYNSDEVRNHCSLYLNYFEKFYDTEHELLLIYYKLITFSFVWELKFVPHSIDYSFPFSFTSTTYTIFN